MLGRKAFYITILRFLPFCLVSCHIAKKCSNCGEIILKNRFYNDRTNTYVKSEAFGEDIPIWYKDDLSIQKIMRLYINIDTNSIETRKLVVDRYTFIDRRTKSFYHYHSFSDTARFDSVYTLPDSVPIIGWNYYYTHHLPFTEPPKELPDTTINDLDYKRIKLINTIKINDSTTFKRISICYFRCGIKTMFSLDTRLSEKMGCPMVWYQSLPNSQDRFPLSMEIEFVANKLNAEELKVFAAWEKNEKLHPVIK